MAVNHTPVSHAVVGSKYVSCLAVVKYVFKYRSYPLNSFVDHSYILQILSTHGETITTLHENFNQITKTYTHFLVFYSGLKYN